MTLLKQVAFASLKVFTDTCSPCVPIAIDEVLNLVRSETSHALNISASVTSHVSVCPTYRYQAKQSEAGRLIFPFLRMVHPFQKSRVESTLAYYLRQDSVQTFYFIKSGVQSNLNYFVQLL